MLVSIIVPFYNVEPYFRRCLDSIVNQSYQELEIILVNDCSPDNSIDIAREYAQKDSRIKIIEHERNLGLGGARNSGLAVATGEYIWFFDSDDAIHLPISVERIVTKIKDCKEKLDVIAFGYESLTIHPKVLQCPSLGINHFSTISNTVTPSATTLIMGSADISNTLVRARSTAECRSIFHMAVWSKWFRREFLLEIDAKQEEKVLHEDAIHYFWLLRAEYILELEEIGYNHYYRTGSLTRSPAPKNYFDQRIALVSQQYSYYSKHLLASKYLDVHILCYHIMLIMLFGMKDKFFSYAKTLSTSEYEEYLSKFTLLFKQIFTREDVLKELEKSPFIHNLLLSNQKDGFLRILMHEEDPAIQLKLIKQLMTPPKRINKFLPKKIVKMMLPHGVIRLIQIRKNKAGK